MFVCLFVLVKNFRIIKLKIQLMDLENTYILFKFFLIYHFVHIMD